MANVPGEDPDAQAAMQTMIQGARAMRAMQTISQDEPDPNMNHLNSHVKNVDPMKAHLNMHARMHNAKRR